MNSPFRTVFICFGLLCCRTQASEVVRKIELPEEGEIYRSSDMPGAALANAYCLTCHSVEYVKYQPTTSPRGYWQATATKMQRTFGAPITAAQLDLIVDYLVKTYGTEIRPLSPPSQKPGSKGP